MNPLGSKKLSTNFSPDFILIMGLLILLLCVYWPSATATFLWDDDKYVYHNELVTSPTGLLPIWSTKQPMLNYWPLSYSVFWLEYQLRGADPQFFLWVNLFLHFCNALLLWRVGLKMGFKQSVWAALIFALHPLNVESVAWVSELKNLLSTLFFLLTCLSWLEYRQTQRQLFHALSCLTFLLSLLSKSSTCVLPALLWLYELTLRPTLSPAKKVNFTQELKHWLTLFLPLSLIAVILTGFFIWAEQAMQSKIQFQLEYPWSDRIAVALQSYWFALQKLFVPLDLMMIYPRWQTDFSSTRVIVSGLLSLIVVIGAVLIKKSWARQIAFLLLLILVVQAPSLGFVRHTLMSVTFVTDHYHYLATLIFAIILAEATPRTLLAISNVLTQVAPDAKSIKSSPLKKLMELKELLKLMTFMFFFTLILIYTTLSWEHKRHFLNQIVLWEDTVKKNPHNFFPRINLGIAYVQNEKWDEALAQVEESLRLNPDFALSYNNRGLILAHKGANDQALQNFSKAIELDPNNARAWNNRGMAYWASKNDVVRACADWRKACELKLCGNWQLSVNNGDCKL